MKDDTISRRAAIALAKDICVPTKDGTEYRHRCIDPDAINELPSAKPDYQEVLSWLCAYHTMSFDLHGRYFPHEVISWLINDFTKVFIAVKREEE